MYKNAEKQVTFYSSYGFRQGDYWSIPLRIWVREKPDLPFVAAAKIFRRMLKNKAGLTTLTDKQKQLFNRRIQAFIEDRESREHVQFVFDNDPKGEVFWITDEEGDTKTDRNGLLEGVLVLSKGKVQQLLDAQQSTHGWLSFHVVSEKHGGIGRVRLVEPQGLSVISDIDDTIKVTDISDGTATVINNTFFRDFKAVPGMADRYRALGDDVSFHYVSGSPWQLYEPLSEFLFGDEVGFPLGSMHMKNVRTNLFESESYQDFWKLLADGSKQTTYNQKVKQISEILDHFPKRKFILIGDSGEADPEIFKYIQSLYPTQVKEIRIRDVLNRTDNERFKGMNVLSSDQ